MPRKRDMNRRKRIIPFLMTISLVLGTMLIGISLQIPKASAILTHDVGNLDIHGLSDFGRVMGPLSWGARHQTVLDFSGLGFIGLVVDQDNYDHTFGSTDIADSYYLYPYDEPDDFRSVYPIEWVIDDGITQKSIASYLNTGTKDPFDILIDQTVWTVVNKDWAIIQWKMTNIKGIDITGVCIGLELPLSQQGAEFGLGGDSGDDIDGYDSINSVYWASDDDGTTIGFASAAYLEPLTHYYSRDYHVEYDTYCRFFEDDEWLYNRLRSPSAVEGAIPGNRTSTVGWNDLHLGIDESITVALVIAMNKTYNDMIAAIDDGREYYLNETTGFLITEFSDSDSEYQQIEVYNFGRPITDLVAEGYFLSVDGGANALTGTWSNNPLPSYEHAVFNVTGGTIGPEGGTIGLYQKVGGDNVLLDEVSFGQEGITPDPLAGESVERRYVLEYTDEWVRNASTGPTWGALNDVGGIYPFSQVVLNEVMFNPELKEDHFVEIYYRDSSTIDISEYRIVGDKEYIVPNNTSLDKDNRYFYLSYSMDNDFFDDPTNGMNSSGDNVYLYDEYGILLDMVGWSSEHTVNTSVSRVPDGNGTSDGYDDDSSVAAGWRFDQIPSFSLIEIKPDIERFCDQGKNATYNLTIMNKHDNDDLVEINNVSGPWGWQVVILNESGYPLNDSNGNGIPDIFVPAFSQVNISVVVRVPMGQSAGDMETTIITVESTCNPLYTDNATLNTIVDYLGAFENITFPVGSFVIPMDDKQNDVIKAFGFMHALLRNDSMIHRIIEPPNVTIKTTTFLGGAVYYGGPVMVLPEYQSIVNSVITSFPSVTLDTLTESFISEMVFAVAEPTNILVIYGSWGLTDTILDEMGIPYTLITTGEAHANSSLIGPPHNLVVVDCTGWSGNAPQNVVDAIRILVENGGEAMFNCFATQTMIQIFPGYVDGNLVSKHTEACNFHSIAEFPAQYYGPTNVTFTDIWAEMDAIHPDVRVVWTTNDPTFNDAALYFPYGKNGGIVEGTIFEPGHQAEGSDSRTFASILYGNKFVHFNLLPDLAISNSDIVFTPSTPVENHTLITINATVHNIGYKNTSSVQVRFYDGPPALGNQIGEDQTISFIQRFGGIGYAEIEWVGTPAGTHNIYVVVDPKNRIAETNETNNIASKTMNVIDISPPILYIKAIGDDVVLNWTQPTTIGLSHYLIYRSTSQTSFDFTNIWVNTSSDNESGEPAPIPLRTVWNDTGAASHTAPREYYYTIRAVFEWGEKSFTSRTVGKYTRVFKKRISSFSLPLELLQKIDTCTLINDMGANYIKWMDPGAHVWKKHNLGDPTWINNSDMVVGKGFEVEFNSDKKFTFTGMPGAMIIYDDDTGFSGFEHANEAKTLIVSVEPNGDVNLTWQEPGSMDIGDRYIVYYSHTRDGFFGTFDVDYFLACPIVPFGTNTATHANAQANNPMVQLYYMVVPFNVSGIRGASTYSIGIITQGYLSQYDTFGIPLKISNYQRASWYCDNIHDIVGINYFIYSDQRWGWHTTRMPEGAYDPVLVMTEGYQLSTSQNTKFTFIGV
ncbi:MAG: lamin tail domain-containing protein [Methanomassiliicoccales archaeon]|nr:MAG: lamin tail domain-containing protein [Methanomassiliicoccales archaeon]